MKLTVLQGIQLTPEDMEAEKIYDLTSAALRLMDPKMGWLVDDKVTPEKLKAAKEDALKIVANTIGN